MKYFLFCDFATIKCYHSKIAKILEENEINFINHNDFFWELDVPTSFGSPMYADRTPAEEIRDLFHNCVDRNSFLLVVKADEYFPALD